MNDAIKAFEKALRAYLQLAMAYEAAESERIPKAQRGLKELTTPKR